jgi:2-methylcitrate dehydratase PrpD
MAEHVDASGRELLEAVIIGYEVFERLGKSGRPTEPPLKARGVHPTSLYGAPAAAAATGRLLGLDHDQMVVALGFAATDAFGLVQQFGSWGKGLHAGNAARTGVQAAVLAEAGYVGDPAGLSGDYGMFAALHGVGPEAFDWMAGDLGSRWSVVDPGLSIKPYPACTSTLRAVDAMLTIAAEPGYDPSDVASITVDINSETLHTLRFRGPTQGFQGKFSLDYTVACAALDQRLSHDSFTDDSAARPEFRRMLERITINEHPEWVATHRVSTPVTVTFASGRSRAEAAETHRGTHAWPLNEAELLDKYLACACQRLSADNAEKSAAALGSLEEADSVRKIVDLLVTA